MEINRNWQKDAVEQGRWYERDTTHHWSAHSKDHRGAGVSVLMLAGKKAFREFLPF